MRVNRRCYDNRVDIGISKHSSHLRRDPGAWVPAPVLRKPLAVEVTDPRELDTRIVSQDAQ
jgi:hypothetical protein